MKKILCIISIIFSALSVSAQNYQEFTSSNEQIISLAEKVYNFINPKIPEGPVCSFHAKSRLSGETIRLSDYNHKVIFLDLGVKESPDYVKIDLTDKKIIWVMFDGRQMSVGERDKKTLEIIKKFLPEAKPVMNK